MKHNGMLINDYDQRTGSYSEKTKTAKCKILVAAAPTMIVPGTEPDAGESPGNAAAAAAPYRRKAKPAKPRGSANRAAAKELVRAFCCSQSPHHPSALTTVVHRRYLTVFANLFRSRATGGVVSTTLVGG